MVTETGLSDLLDQIDTLSVPECAQCGGSLTESPSDDFCGPDCQERWHTLRSYELVGYREPLYEWATLGPSPEDFEVGAEADYRVVSLLLGVSVADLSDLYIVEWPAFSPRADLAAVLAPVPPAPALPPLPDLAPTAGPQRRDRAPRTLGRMR